MATVLLDHQGEFAYEVNFMPPWGRDEVLFDHFAWLKSHFGHGTTITHAQPCHNWAYASGYWIYYFRKQSAAVQFYMTWGDFS